tara:strand:- start:624 stop:3578 length:2955 start_codon:yes stop_codon:yes gene_type:complete
MYITLNSENEPSNADFKNYFNDTLTIQPNSYICLSSLGLSKDDTDISLGYVETFNYRIAFGAFDFSRNFAVPAASYTAESLCDTMNILSGQASPVWECLFSVEEVPDVGQAIVVKWRRAEGFRGIVKYAENFLIVNAREGALGNAFETLNSDAEIFRGIVNWNCFFLRGKLANNYNYITAINAPTGLRGARNNDFYVPNNMIGKNTFDINRDQGELSFTVATPELESNFYMLKPGVLTTQDDGTVIENPGITPPNGANIELIFRGNVFDLKARKRDDTVEVIFVEQEYNPGTSFHITCIPDPAATSTDNCYAYSVVRKGLSNGQVCWIPFDSVNSASIDPDTIIQMYDTADWHKDSNLTRYQSTVIGDSMTGIRMGATSIGASTNRFQLTCQYKSNGDVIAKNTGTDMPNNHSIILNRNKGVNNLNQHIQIADYPIQSSLATMFSIGFRLEDDTVNENTLYGGAFPIYDLSFGSVWTTTATPGLEATYTFSTSEAEHWDFVQTRNTGPTTHYWRRQEGNYTNFDIWYTDPSGINPIPATDLEAVLDLNTYKISFPTIPGTILDPSFSPLPELFINGPIVTFTNEQAGIQLYYNDRSSDLVIPLLNGTGAQWTPSTVGTIPNNYISICANGIGNNYFVMVTDDTDQKYWITVAKGSNAAFPDLNRIGADTDVLNDAANRARRYNGEIFDFRTFQYNQPSGGVKTLGFYRNVHNNIADSTLGISGNYSNAWLFSQDIISTDFDGGNIGGFENYGILGQPSVWARHNSCFYKQDSLPEKMTNWMAYGDFSFPMTRTLENLDRTEDNIVMGQAANINSNFLTVHTDSETILTKNEVPSVSLLTEQDYVAGRPSTISAEYIDLTTDGPENVIASSTGDKIDNFIEEEIEHCINVEITNLSHRSYNGRSHNISKSIMEVPLNNASIRKLGDVDLVGYEPPVKIWHSLQNGSEIVLNQLEVKISDEALRTVTNLRGPTNLAIEIKTKDEIF